MNQSSIADQVQTKLDNVIQGMVTVHPSSEERGSGFLVGENYVITNAHCLPRLPDPLVSGDDVVYLTLRARLDPRIEAIGEVLFCDPVGDIAVVVSPSRQDRFDEMARFDFLVSHLSSLTVITGRMDHGTKLRSHVLAIDDKWMSGNGTVNGLMNRGLGVVMDCSDGCIPGGTSGAPIVSDEGNVIAVLRIGSLSSPEYYGNCLCDGLPSWLVNEIRRAQI